AGLLESAPGSFVPAPELLPPAMLTSFAPVQRPPRLKLRLALPDGHAQAHTIAALMSAGVRVFGYEDGTVVRRPQIDIDGVEVKVIRPQDMPQQVAIGHFDLAITGRDWL